jgi:hypothetical protein
MLEPNTGCNKNNQVA